MKYALILISLFFTANLIADDGEEVGMSERIPLSAYQVTPTEVKSAVLDIVLRNWEIDSHTMNSIKAHYKNAELEVVIDDSFVTLKELPSGSGFSEKWLKTLNKYITERLQYYHYLRLMTES